MFINEGGLLLYSAKSEVPSESLSSKFDNQIVNKF